MKNPLSDNPVFFPGRLINIWEMNQLLTERFLNAWISFRNEFHKSARNKERPLAILSRDDRKLLIQAIDAIHEQCHICGFKSSKTACRELLKQLTDVAWHWDAPRYEAIIHRQPEPPMGKQIPHQTYQQIYAQLRLIFAFLREEMEEIKLVVIKTGKVRFFEQDALFGPVVKASASPELNAEIRAAGNCLAADLNTAAVFHLMRAVEHGMRALAPQLNVSMSPRQISQKTWSILIGAMDDEIREAQHPKKMRKMKSLKPGQKPLKPGQLKFYRGLLLNINSFKDLWRNDVMHTRGNYTDAEAEGVFEHVKDFIVILASKVPLK